MANVRIDSQGFSIGRWYFPPFTLHHGECTSLQFPKEAVVDQNRIVHCLTGMEQVPGLRLHSAALFAKRATNPSGWRRWFQASSPFAWLKRNTSLSDDAIRSLLLKHNIDRSRCGGNHGAILGLEAAYAREPDVVVFSTSGLDPIGVRDVFRIVSDHLPECPAIYLAWPFFCQEKLDHNFVPGSTIVSVVDKNQMAFAS